MTTKEVSSSGSRLTLRQDRHPPRYNISSSADISAKVTSWQIYQQRQHVIDPDVEGNIKQDFIKLLLVKFMVILIPRIYLLKKNIGEMYLHLDPVHVMMKVNVLVKPIPLFINLYIK